MSNSRIYWKELPGFTRKLSTMLSSGLPLLSALGSLQRQAGSSEFKTVLQEISVDLEAGSTLADAMSSHPEIFDALYVNITAAGSAGGRLPETLERLADHLESSLSLRRRVRGACIYPAFVIGLAALICTGMIVFAMPIFTGVYADAGADLPALTALMLGISESISSNIIEIVILVTAVVLLFVYLKNTAAGSFYIDSMKLRMPVIGDLSRKIAATRFARTYGELIRSGVPAMQALEVSSGVSGNAVIERILIDARATIESGHPLSDAFSNQAALPYELIEMLKAGEKSGRVDDMLENLAGMYDEEIRATVTALLSILTPVIIVILGVIVGTIVISIYLPILQLPGIL